MTGGGGTSIEEWLLETSQSATLLPESSVDGFLADLHRCLEREGLVTTQINRGGPGALAATVVTPGGTTGGMLTLRRALALASYGDFSCVWTGEEDDQPWARLLTGFYDEHDDCSYLMRLKVSLRPARNEEEA